MSVVTGPAMYVCRHCGPQSLCFAGRIVPVVCDKCKSHGVGSK